MGRDITERQNKRGNEKLRRHRRRDVRLIRS
jgi:hypothetical protein